MGIPELILLNNVKIDYDEKERSHARFIIAPLNRGYGHTLGNSLRRVLLSSIKGFAVTALKIDGCLHEYSTLSNVKEDFWKIILNMRNVFFSLDNNIDRVYLNLNTSGKLVVCASDIQLPTGVSIDNSDAVIANLDMGADFKMDIEVSSGFGYVSSNLNIVEGRPVGFIAVDSLFSPVKKVVVDVQSMRVGQVTDYDRLVIDVYTNGVVSAFNVFVDAVRILRDGFAALGATLGEYLDEEGSFADRVFSIPEKNSGFEEGENSGLEDMEDSIDNSNEKDNNQINDDESDELAMLSGRSRKALDAIGIRTIVSLRKQTEQDLQNCKNLGEKSITEIKSFLVAQGDGYTLSDS